MKRYELFDRDNSGSETEPVEYLDGDWVRYQDAVTAVAAERERWRAALSHTVAEADGWHDESHGGPIMSDPKMEDARALLHPAIAQPAQLALETEPAHSQIIKLLREARLTLEMWKDVAPAVSLCKDIDNAFQTLVQPKDQS